MQPSPQSLEDVQHNPFTGFFPVFDGGGEAVAQGILAQYAWSGVSLPSASQAIEGANNGTWGIGAASRDMDEVDQLSAPYAASEVIRAFDVQRCIDVAPDVITPDGVLFELVHQRVPSGAIGIIEDVPTILEVSAVEGQAPPVAIFTYGNLNGERPCLSELIHPSGGAGFEDPLTWRFHLTWEGDPYLGAQDSTYIGPVNPNRVAGRAILPPWADARYGINNRWAAEKQCLAPASSVVRLWVELRGSQHAFMVRVGARLGGFYQFAGRKGAALNNSLVRHT